MSYALPQAVCKTCPRHCRLADGAVGFCRARKAEGGRVVAANYGMITSLALDPSVIEELAPLIDAANIDLKGPSQEYYDWVGGDFAAVCRTIKTLHSAGCHVEVTTLVVPGRNDADGDIDAIADFIASVSSDIPLHVTRFFPRFQMTGAAPTPVATVRRLAEIARRRLTRVLVGNVG